MSKIDQEILNINKSICSNIDFFEVDQRWLLSQNILDKLRNFVEHIALKIYAKWEDIDNNYQNITQAIEYIKAMGSLKFLNKFHYLLQKTTSHYTQDEDKSERLMLKYYEYLIQIKSYLKEKYNLNVLKNIDNFPIQSDPELEEYYKKIVEKIEEPKINRKKSVYEDRYYIKKTKPFFVNKKVYYEVTFTIASDKTSKFDRIIAFTSLDILPNYAVKLNISHDHINILWNKMPIQIIDDRKVSIRPCELNHYADFFWDHVKISTWLIEYTELMKLLTKTWLNLVDVIEFSDDYYDRFKEAVLNRAKSNHIFTMLDKVRQLTIKNGNGSNVMKYLLYTLNNKILKLQYINEPCPWLSNLYLKWGCKPFDQMPFNSSLLRHNPRISSLFDCFDSTNRKHELLARLIKNNTETKWQLYTQANSIVNWENIDELISLYNSEVYKKHTNRHLINYKDNIYIKWYEEDTVSIIQKIKELSSSWIKNYANSVEARLQSWNHLVDCLEKKEILTNIFEKSHVVMIYGSAGTWKTTLINHISNFHKDANKLFLANTNPAVNNLERRISAGNRTIQTIAKFLSNHNSDSDYDLIFIDECSTVSNKDMLSILQKASFKLLVLVGDIFQIESIRFGNWFSISKELITNTSVFELTKPYRSKNERLLNFWDKVRNIEDDILEHIVKNSYSATLDNSIFQKTDNDEIILCLNYDWLYWINNINKFLQESNTNEAIEWWVHTYKIDDPILFNDSDRFKPLIYNNLKWRIINIMPEEHCVRFDIEIDKSINEFDTYWYDIILLEDSDNNKSIIRFSVNKLENTDEDNNQIDSIVPFQVAYAVSMHKAQWLEYNSVKIVITNEIEESITHNLFYTAVTRAKEKLTIYWTPETEKKILSNLKKNLNNKDINLLKAKFNL